MQRRFLVKAVAAHLPLLATLSARGQGYPSGPVNVVLPLQAGSASDVALRAAAERLGNRMGGSFVVENVVGAAGLIGLDRLSRAKPDGQTLAALNNSIMTVLPHLQGKKMKGDPREDFTPIAGLANIPTFLGVKRGSPFRNAPELIAAAKKQPDRLTYSSGGVGSPQHLASEMFRAYTGAQMTHVPYKGASQAALALAAGEVDVMMIALSLAQPFLPDERVRLIGYCGTQRHPQFSDLPTLQEQGVANFDYSSWIGLFAPSGTPAPIVETLRRQTVAVAGERELHSQLIRMGLEPWQRSASELQKVVDVDWARWGKIIRTSKIQSE